MASLALISPRTAAAAYRTEVSISSRPFFTIRSASGTGPMVEGGDGLFAVFDVAILDNLEENIPGRSLSAGARRRLRESANARGHLRRERDEN